MNNVNENILQIIKSKFDHAIIESIEFRDELTITFQKEEIIEVCKFCKENADLDFNLLADLCGIDMYVPEKRLGVVYNLYSFNKRHRIRFKIFTEEENPIVPSVTSIWGTANWHEREAFDMYGIIFEGHPDLRRIYMPDEFEYYPLRKDFPLMGIPGSLELPKK